MFESLKKKFSRTSEKLEEELIEEAEAEDNLQEESGSRFSFFSFGKKNKEEEKEEEVEEENLLPEPEEEIEEEAPDEIEEVVEEEEVPEEVEEEEAPVEEVKEEKKSRFWNRNKDKEETSEEDEDSIEEVEEEKKSHFWSRNKDKDEPSEDEDVEEEAPEEEKKSHFWSRNKDKDEDKSDVSADGEAKGGIFSFVREKTIQEKHVEDILFELEMELLQGDVAMEVATEVVESVKENLVGKKIKRSNDITEYTFYALRDAVEEIISIPGKSMTEMIEEKKAQGEPLVVMFVGINGTGKTTTIGKLANYYMKKGYTPVIAASDTFRAGAIEQVTYHADNVGVKIIKHQKGSDPAAVAYDAVEHARAQGKELVLIDTAGRMQTNTNLMDEMKKIKRVSKPDLVIFVGDAITGNDATEQARKFNEAIDIDGVILTKADADSKGGASLSIGYVIQKPIMFLGVGQGYDDIMEYDSEWMLNQLFSDDEEVVADEA
ncbi:MAG: signal recognition particle-docking protein FtsY [Methanobrevibacter thaueri]|uniref:signal recognition particle-docking protein FtsY n=1 Tax=Methanobrevibacter thaueri TaxID=190975 RepID=UPI0026EBEAA0|nr:signal recognition particle-docking protein FtsY [Methanobrevibacter thaueri]MBE6495259.1 signal recognition particle-docking protein FtsY [Methanobrevibacter thaueri]